MKNLSLLQLIRYARVYRSTLVKSSTFSALKRIFALLPAVIIALTIDLLANKQQSLIHASGLQNIELQVAFLSLLALLIWSNRSILSYFSEVQWHKISDQVHTQLRRETFDQLQILPLNQVEELQTNSLRHLDIDLYKIKQFIAKNFDNIVQIITQSILILTVFYLIEPQIAIIASLPIPLFLVNGIYFQKKLAKEHDITKTNSSRLGSEIDNTLSHMISYQTLNRKEEFERLDSNFKQASAQEAATRATQGPLIQGSILIGMLGVILIGAHHALNGSIALFQYILLWLWTPKLLKPLGYLPGIFQDYQEAKCALKRLFTILNLPAQVETANNHPRLDEAIIFKNVHFHFKAFKSVIHGLSLTIAPGQVSAIYGPQGSGKSTVMKLMLGFYQPLSGSIEIGNTPLHTINRQYLHQNVSYLSQDPYLFTGTIEANICDQNEVSNARLLALINRLDMRFIHDLPRGLQTPLGEISKALTPYQKQQIAFARALYRQSAIIIFDHFLDAFPHYEHRSFSKILETEAKNSTVIVITHQRVTDLRVDHCYRMENGHLIPTSHVETTPAE